MRYQDQLCWRVRAQRDALLFLVFVVIIGIDHMAAGSQTQLLKIKTVQCPAADNSIDQLHNMSQGAPVSFYLS